MKIVQPFSTDYLRFLPPKLHQAAHNFVDYLTYFPFERPQQCPCCGSLQFYLERKQISGQKAPRLDEYRCRNCRALFNSLTRTPLTKIQFPEQWGDIGRYLLAGSTKRQISKQIGLSFTSVTTREKAFEKVMREQFLDLYQWWIINKYGNGNLLAPQIQEQATQFQVWMQNLLNPSHAFCPRCGKKERITPVKKLKNTANFRCLNCRLSFSMLSKTQFKFTHDSSLLLPFATQLISGNFNRELEEKIGLGESSVNFWRDRMTKQMRLNECGLLADWVEWQHTCKLRYALIKRHKKHEKTP